MVNLVQAPCQYPMSKLGYSAACFHLLTKLQMFLLHHFIIIFLRFSARRLLIIIVSSAMLR